MRLFIFRRPAGPGSRLFEIDTDAFLFTATIGWCPLKVPPPKLRQLWSHTHRRRLPVVLAPSSPGAHHAADPTHRRPQEERAGPAACRAAAWCAALRSVPGRGRRRHSCGRLGDPPAPLLDGTCPEGGAGRSAPQFGPAGIKDTQSAERARHAGGPRPSGAAALPAA